MSSMEAKREQFRKYLERCGLLDALCKSLIKLYEEQNKPDDAIRYVRRYLCEACPDDEQFLTMKHDLTAANNKIAALEEEVERFKGQIKRTPSQTALILEEGWTALVSDEECDKSLLRKYLTREVFDQLKVVNTKAGATLLDCIQSGFKHHDSSIGLYAADAESYELYKSLFDNIIIEYHGVEDATQASFQKETDWGNIGDIKNLDPEGKYIQSTRIRTARNLDEYPFFSILTEEQFKEIEEKVKGVVENMSGDLKGSYQTMKAIDVDTQREMVKRHILFEKGNEILNTAGAYRFWPSGRGLYCTPDEDFLVWVNEEDHLRIISMTKSGDLHDVYKRLVSALKNLEKNLKFARHPRYGNVTSCPTNLGTTIRASVHIKLPKLSRNPPKLEEKAKSLQLQIRGTGGEHTDIEGGVMDISNKRRLGCTEFELIKTLQDGILELIKLEEEGGLLN